MDLWQGRTRERTPGVGGSTEPGVGGSTEPGVGRSTEPGVGRSPNSTTDQFNYTTKPITEQNQSHNKINYTTKSITECTNSKPTQQQINSIPTQNQFNTNSTSIQCCYHHYQLNAIQLDQLHQTQLNPTCISSMNDTDECEACAENACLQIKTNRNKLYK